MVVPTKVRGLVENENAVRRLGDELRRVRTIAIFLARGVLKMQQARQVALTLPPEACKEHLLNEFPILHGPKAEETVQRLASLADPSADRAETKHMGRAALREGEGWVPVTLRFPGAQPYTWSRSVLVLLDTGGVAISSYFDRQNLEGQWLNLEEGFGTVTHWHELPPVPPEQEQEEVLGQLEKLERRKQIKKPWKTSRQQNAKATTSRATTSRAATSRPAQSLEDSLVNGKRRSPREPQPAPNSAPPAPQIPLSIPVSAPSQTNDINWI